MEQNLQGNWVLGKGEIEEERTRNGLMAMPVFKDQQTCKS
jgi:hypothetical protein